MDQSLPVWLGRLAYIDEAEAGRMLYTLFRRCFDASDEDRDHSTAYTIGQACVRRAGTNRGHIDWQKLAPRTSEDPPRIPRAQVAWLYVEILLREPFDPTGRKDFKLQDVLELLNARWMRDFGRGLMPEAVEFIKANFSSKASISFDSLEVVLSKLVRRTRRDLPKLDVGWLLEMIVVTIDIPPIENMLMSIARLLRHYKEGRRQLGYLSLQGRIHQLAVYLRVLVLLGVLVMACSIPGCMRNLDQTVRHSWFVWRGEVAPEAEATLVMLDGWRSVASDRKRLVDTLGDVLSYGPLTVGVDVLLMDEYPGIDDELKGMLSDHPEVVLVGEHTPYGLTPPPETVTGVQYFADNDEEGRIASNLLRFHPPWWTLGRYDDYELRYRQGNETRVSLAGLMLLNTGRTLRHDRLTINYLCSAKLLKQQPCYIMEELLYGAADDSVMAAAMRESNQLAISGKHVLIGVDAHDQDRHASPFDRLAPPKNGIPGAMVQFFALLNELEPSYRISGLDWLTWPLIIVLYILSVLLIRKLRWYHPVVPVLIISGTYFAGVLALVVFGAYLPWLPVTLMLLSAYPVLCLTIAADRERKVRRLCG